MSKKNDFRSVFRELLNYFLIIKKRKKMKANFKKFEELELNKANLAVISGGTTTTSYIVIGYSENEYEDCNGDGTLSEEEMKSQTPILVQFPDNTGGC